VRGKGRGKGMGKWWRLRGQEKGPTSSNYPFDDIAGSSCSAGDLNLNCGAINDRRMCLCMCVCVREIKERQTSFRFCSSLSRIACLAFFSDIFCFSSSNLAFFSSSVNGAISSVDSEKSTCSLFRITVSPLLLKDIPRLPRGSEVTYVLDAWNSACAMLLNFFPHSLHIMLFATSPSLRASGSMVGSVSAFVEDAGAVSSSSGLSWLSSSHWRAPCTMTMRQI